MITQRDYIEMFKAFYPEQVATEYSQMKFECWEDIERFFKRLYEARMTNIVITQSKRWYTCQECEHEGDMYEEQEDDVEFECVYKPNRVDFGDDVEMGAGELDTNGELGLKEVIRQLNRKENYVQYLINQLKQNNYGNS
jgi:hypothetical protein